LRLPRAERAFHKTPRDWKNDINFFRLGVVCSFVETELDVKYIEDQREVQQILYTNPSDLFVNGVMDTRRGTCGNMAVLHLALGWRLGWPVSLACIGSHFILRYDDGTVTHNIEATQADYGGFRSSPDDVYLREHRLPRLAIDCGSDLRALTARETVGAFLGLRGRHMRDTGRFQEAQADYQLARWLYPNSRRLYIDAMALAVPQGAKLFESGELGSPESLLGALYADYGYKSVTVSATATAFAPAIRVD